MACSVDASIALMRQQPNRDAGDDGSGVAMNDGYIAAKDR